MNYDQPRENNYLTAARASIGIIDLVICVLMLIMIGKLDTVANRAQQIIKAHDNDMVLLSQTARVRNQSVRLISQKLGVDTKELDAILAEDWLANQDLRWKRSLSE